MSLHADDAALALRAAAKKGDKKRAREDESDEERAARRAAKKAKRALLLEGVGSDDSAAAPPAPAAAAKKPRLAAPPPASLAAAAVETPVAAGSGKAAAAPAVDTRAFLAEHSMSVTLPAGVAAVPAPMTTFASTGFSSKITAQFTKAGYTAPTLTQQMAWPLTLLNRNIVTVAKTGSGKTLAFLLPVFTRMLAPGSGRVAPKPGNAGRPTMLVMAPTRELAVQIEEEASKFGGAVGLRTTVCYGGAPKYNQCRILKGGVDVVIGTPGRLKDLLNMGVLDLGAVQYLVLDEADRMLDMGFEDDMRELCGYTPPGRQTLLFTATWPRVVERLAGELCPEPIRFSVGDTNKLSANPSIKQTIEMVSGADAKAARLQALFTSLFMKDGKPDPEHGKAIVFMAYKGACNGIAQGLWDAGFAVDTLHGDMVRRCAAARGRPARARARARRRAPLEP